MCDERTILRRRILDEAARTALAIGDIHLSLRDGLTPRADQPLEIRARLSARTYAQFLDRYYVALDCIVAVRRELLIVRVQRAEGVEADDVARPALTKIRLVCCVAACGITIDRRIGSRERIRRTLPAWATGVR